ncbi:NAD(P)/FAD-dependent oxidoreductase [Aquicoccus sp. G2-2]|uniref:NAD(P)/FAD-dependent oxidoreductase n=1 Tax=Aquicoccus sp. G2-2 TaxID=3092120 RepID=UPI002ADF3C02|nr:FAD-binding oxidoreductase [Aquicoccus sp. G2-2]MEA1112811.1 FAD-binding oxidoreductase [Aquicoccus sp. G2-2]
MDLIKTPFWWEEGAALPPPCARAPERVELAVVGGGFTGLSAALTGAEKGAQVAVFDAGQPGQGASTRNGGMIGAPHRPELAQELETYGADLAGRLVHEGIKGYAHTRALHEAAGAYQHTGRVMLAYTRAQHESLRRQADLLNGFAPQGIEWLNADEMQAHIRTERYFGGLHFPDHGAVQPRKAHDALLARAQAAGVEICAECGVTGLTPEGDGFRLETEKGSTWARRVVWATNGYTGTVNRFLARRIFRIPSFIVATEELPAGVIDRLAPGRRMMVETRARHSYFRPSPDGKRILFGGRAAMVPISHEAAARRLQATMAEIWPEAAEWRLTHSWQGYVGFTFAMTPHVGVHEGVHFAYGYCGNGVALSPWLGRKAALRALGDPDGATAFAETRLESRPYHIGGVPWFMAIASPWWRFVVDRRDSAAAARDRARS